MDIITMTLGAGLFIQSILLAKDAYDVDRASNPGLVVEELANTPSSRGRNVCRSCDSLRSIYPDARVEIEPEENRTAGKTNLSIAGVSCSTSPRTRKRHH